MRRIPLGEFMVTRAGTVTPSAFPDERFDLFSIPAHDMDGFEEVRGAEVGSAKQLVQPGDVMISKIVPHIRRARVVSQSRGRRQIASGEWILFRSEQFDSNYLRHYLLSDQFHSQFMSTVAGVGGSLLRARPAQVKAIQVPLPNMSEQRRIAAILDQADALRTLRREADAARDELADALFRDAFLGRARVTTEPVTGVCSLVVDCVNRTAPTVDGPTPYRMIRTTNVRAGRVDTLNVRYVSAETFERWNRRATPRDGDVLLTREAPVGEAGILRGNDNVFLGQRLMLYRPDPAKITAEYLLAAFRSRFLREQFERHASGSTVKHLPLPACRSFEIPLPSLELQVEYSRRVRALDVLRADAAKQATEMDTLAQSVAAQAFAGDF